MCVKETEIMSVEPELGSRGGKAGCGKLGVARGRSGGAPMPDLWCQAIALLCDLFNLPSLSLPTCKMDSLSHSDLVSTNAIIGVRS